MSEMSNHIKCIIVDDEPPAQRVLEKYISEIPFLKLEAKCKNVFEASDLLHKKEIDLLFLDINMPKMSGMDFLRTLKDPPFVIITSAYSEYALVGFELNVTDYLQKPFSFPRFLQAVNKVSMLLQSSTDHTSSSSNNSSQTVCNDFIFVREDKKNYRVNIMDILFLESVGDYVKVHTQCRTYLVYQTLSNFMNLLDPNIFMRVHKSFIIPFSRIDSIEGNTIKIGGQIIPVGITFRKDFSQAIRKYKML